MFTTEDLLVVETKLVSVVFIARARNAWFESRLRRVFIGLSWSYECVNIIKLYTRYKKKIILGKIFFYNFFSLTAREKDVNIIIYIFRKLFTKPKHETNYIYYILCRPNSCLIKHCDERGDRGLES